MSRPYLPLETRFWARVQFEPNSGCWLWNTTITAGGYGSMCVAASKYMPAHRFSYEMHKGPIPPGLVIDHLCRTRCCVNPAHLEAVTLPENIKRGISGAYNKQKTHCRNGHEYTAENTRIVTSNGYRERVCKTCSTAADRAYKRKNRIALNKAAAARRRALRHRDPDRRAQ